MISAADSRKLLEFVCNILQGESKGPKREYRIREYSLLDTDYIEIAMHRGIERVHVLTLAAENKNPDYILNYALVEILKAGIIKKEEEFYSSHVPTALKLEANR